MSRIQTIDMSNMTYDDADVLLPAERQEFGKRRMVKEGVSSRQQEAIEVSLSSQPGLHFPLVHTGAYRRNHPLGTQLCKGSVCSLHRLVEMIVRVMNQ